uniref:Uncharacterized protein n=1 Tax=Rhizophora mucronata TaxID=61149 RepID=A0A2P2Q0S0_RHIMU
MDDVRDQFPKRQISSGSSHWCQKLKMR